MAGYYILAICTLASLLVGLLIVLSGARGRQGQLYLLLTVSFITLSIANALSFDSRFDQLLFMRLVMFTTTISTFVMYLFVRAVRLKKQLLTKSALFISAATGVVAILDWTPWLFSGYIQSDPPQPVAELGAVLFFIHFLGLIIIIMSSLFRGIHDAQGLDKQRLRLLAAGFIPIVVFAPITGFILPLLFKVPSLAILNPIYTFIFVFFVGYAITKHGLFDVKQAAVRSTAYISSLSALAVAYYIVAYVISETFFNGRSHSTFGVGPLNIFLALVLAFIFQPVKQFFDRITDRIFYRDRYETSDFLIRVGNILTSTTELNDILHNVSQEIRQTLKAGGSLFLVYRDHHPNKIVADGIDKKFSEKELAALDAVSQRTQGCLIVVDRLRIPESPEDAKIFRLLTKKHIALVLPLMSTNEIIGYFMLGDHLSGSYSKQDIDALKAVANELVIAVQNARAVQAIRDLNAHLEQRVEDATKELRKNNEELKRSDEAKDEFVSMASHQLRTPLTSVKGYISMVLEGDAGKITPMQRKLLGEAFTSSERMVHLIGDFLNVSRIQTGKFMLERNLVNLADLVEDEVQGLKGTARARLLTLRYRKPSRFPSLYIDGDKIHQVIMNFIDNAIYYSAEDTTITVRLMIQDGEAVFEVRDTGIGVPKEEQARLFTKFFRATNARRQRPDGTGIGLYLAKKVILAHGGSMVFRSVEGEGSTFGFRLPIKKLSEPPKDTP